MQLQVTQENLNKALGTVARIASTRNTLPILSNVLVRTIEGRLSIAATNLDIAITQYIGAKIVNEGAITLPARLMQDLISSLPNGVIQLDLEDNRLRITTDQYQSVINGVAADDFPVMPAISSGSTWSVPAAAFKKGLQQIIMAASNDESRPVLTGVLLHTHDGHLYAAATDSYRLAEKDLGANTADIKLLVPASAIQDLLRVLGDGDDVTLSVTHDEQQVLFQTGDIDLVSRLIEGKYPDYRKLLPLSFAVESTIKREDMLSVTKVSSLFARENAGSVTVRVDEASQSLSIHSIASQLGENTATAPGKIKGSGSITLNSRYLLDALHALSGDSVYFGFNGKLEPTLLRDPASDSYSHVIMPLKS